MPALGLGLGSKSGSGTKKRWVRKGSNFGISDLDLERRKRGWGERRRREVEKIDLHQEDIAVAAREE